MSEWPPYDLTLSTPHSRPNRGMQLEWRTLDPSTFELQTCATKAEEVTEEVTAEQAATAQATAQLLEAFFVDEGPEAYAEDWMHSSKGAPAHACDLTLRLSGEVMDGMDEIQVVIADAASWRIPRLSPPEEGTSEPCGGVGQESYCHLGFRGSISSLLRKVYEDVERMRNGYPQHMHHAFDSFLLRISTLTSGSAAGTDDFTIELCIHDPSGLSAVAGEPLSWVKRRARSRTPDECESLGLPPPEAQRTVGVRRLRRRMRWPVTGPDKPIALHPDHPNLDLSGYQPEPGFHSVNSKYPGLQLIHRHPDIFLVNEFLTPRECERIIAKGRPRMVRSQSTVVGADGKPLAGVIYSNSRTSTVANMRRAEAPGIVAKCLDLLALGGGSEGTASDQEEHDVEHDDNNNGISPEEYLEVLQVIRYEKGQWNKPHHDGPDGPFSLNGFVGSARMGTLLVYLQDAGSGGATHFNNLNLRVQPKTGLALIHMPSSEAPEPLPPRTFVRDRRAFHEGEAADDEKWILATWLWADPRGDDGRFVESAYTPLSADVITDHDSVPMEITLANGLRMPACGFGTANLQGPACTEVVCTALEAGYRLFDTAVLYNNEAEIGMAVRASSIPREHVFLTDKLHPTDLGYEATHKAVRSSLNKLEVAYIDLYLIHWPGSFNDDSEESVAQLRLDTWRALSECHAEGLLKAVGVSNFTIEQLEALHEWSALNGALEWPHVLQCERHPHLQQTHLLQFCRAHNIVFQAYSPLGGIRSKGALLREVTVEGVATKHKRTIAQCLLRWALQEGVGVLTSSSKPRRMQDNFALWDFALDDGDMESLRALDVGKHYYWHGSEVK